MSEIGDEGVREAARAILRAILRDEEHDPLDPGQRKHGLMGTNPHTRSLHGEEDNGVRGSGGPSSFNVPTYESKLEAWHETGVFPWQPQRGEALVPVDGRKLRRRLRRYRREELLTRHLITRRPWEAWKTLRYGADYWREW